MRNIVVATVTLLVLFCDGVYAQDKPAKDTTTPNFEEHITINLMLVDALVTDSRGNFIHNLSKEDFRIYENGRPVEIVSVDEYVSNPASSNELGSIASGSIESFESAPLPRNIILVFDFFYSSPRSIRRAAIAAEEFLNSVVRPNDNIMIVSYTGSLEILQSLTNDKDKALERLENLGLTGGKVAFLLDYFRQPTSEELSVDVATAVEIDPLFADHLRSILESNKDFELYEEQNEIQNYFDSMKLLAGIIGQIPGRKSLILLSEGIKFDSLLPTNDERDWGLTARLKPPMLREYNDILKEINNSNTSFYTINTIGLRESADVYSSTSEAMTAKVVNGRSRQDFLSNIANETGGKAYFNSNNLLDHLKDVSRDIGNYYVIGYRSSYNPENYEYRSIDVGLNIDGAKVKHRQGYYTPRPFSVLSAGERRMHLHEGFLSRRDINENNAVVKFLALPLQADEASLVMSVEIPVEIATQESDSTEYELWSYNLDSSGELVSGFHRLYRIGREDVEVLSSEGLRIVESLEISQGDNFIGLGIRNNTTGERSYFFLDQHLTAASPDSLMVSPPILFDPENVQRSSETTNIKVGNVGLEEDTVNSGRDFMVHPIHGRVFPLLVPSISQNGSVQKFFVFIDNLLLEEGESPKFEVRYLVSPIVDGQVSDEIIELKTGKPELSKFREGQRLALESSFDPAELQPGEYALIAIVADKNTKRIAQGSSRLRVVEAR